MQEIDHAIKTVLTRKPNSVLDLIFGSRRSIRLKEVADSQINMLPFPMVLKTVSAAFQHNFYVQPSNYGSMRRGY